MDVVPVSTVILAKNERDNIDRCLASLRWCDDCVVIDDGSTDGTADVARKWGARVVEHRFESFAKQRNWALAEVSLRHDWVLMLDADEAATGELTECLRRTLSTVGDEVVAFRMCRKTMFGDQWLKYSDGFPVWIMRLVKRGRAWFADQGHGEVPVPAVDGGMGTIPEPFIHYPFSRGLSDWLQRHIRYAEREAIRELAADSEAGWQSLFSRQRDVRRRGLRAISRRLPCRGMLRFGYQYVLKRGFLDGKVGLEFCRLMGIYESMIVAKKAELRHEAIRESERSSA